MGEYPDQHEVVAKWVQSEVTHDQIVRSLSIPPDDHEQAFEELGTGFKVSAQDTVPFCIWSADYQLDNYEKALWRTVRGRGDCDTTCAIVGGIVALSADTIPAARIERREALPVI
jgi:ADP-ribosylglycohydrolase